MDCLFQTLFLRDPAAESTGSHELPGSPTCLASSYLHAALLWFPDELQTHKSSCKLPLSEAFSQSLELPDVCLAQINSNKLLQNCSTGLDVPSTWPWRPRVPQSSLRASTVALRGYSPHSRSWSGLCVAVSALEVAQDCDLGLSSPGRLKTLISTACHLPS